jgi:excinuclease UvrABC ATPase subunit
MFIIFIAFSLTINAQNQFVGVKTCGMCHKKADQGEQLKIWEGSAHAKAFETLKSEEATKIAGGKAYEKAECLSCHVTGHDVDAALLGSKFNMEDGVQCETCHGAGSEYKSKKTMEDHAKSVAAGMKDYKDEAAIEAQCITCHNDKSPTHKEFNFKKMWAKIAHPVPSKG